MGEVRPLASEEVDTLRRAGEAGQLLLAPSPLATSREGSSPPLPLSCPVAAAPRAAAAGKSTLLGIGAATTAAVESLERRRRSASSTQFSNSCPVPPKLYMMMLNVSWKNSMPTSQILKVTKA